MSCPPKLPKNLIFIIIFFESEFGPIPKKGGINPWSFQVGTSRQVAPPPPLKPAAGSASVAVRTNLTSKYKQPRQKQMVFVHRSVD